MLPLWKVTGHGDAYKIEQLHFHFGCENNKGSEHTVDGQRYSGEVTIQILYEISITCKTFWCDQDNKKEIRIIW